jgi:uncharacterized small protein (DUF1192 family)
MNPVETSALAGYMGDSDQAADHTAESSSDAGMRQGQPEPSLDTAASASAQHADTDLPGPDTARANNEYADSDGASPAADTAIATDGITPDAQSEQPDEAEPSHEAELDQAQGQLSDRVNELSERMAELEAENARLKAENAQLGTDVMARLEHLEQANEAQSTAVTGKENDTAEQEPIRDANTKLGIWHAPSVELLALGGSGAAEVAAAIAEQASPGRAGLAALVAGGVGVVASAAAWVHARREKKNVD